MVDGLILGLISWLSSLISWWHLPLFIKKFTVKHNVISDICFTTLIYLAISTISKSLIALVACVFSGLLMNFTLMLLKQKFMESIWNQEYSIQ